MRASLCGGSKYVSAIEHVAAQNNSSQRLVQQQFGKIFTVYLSVSELVFDSAEILVRWETRRLGRVDDE
jgi:hypothetical protein